ncbi:MAG: Gfo/Idh/MocA family oxidoreductase [Thermoproteales archaeon]|nr:Gfo/Idh/MocA family oxidoreductase [Thermoproteales archaeon]
MRKDTVNICVVGLGMGYNHAKAYAKLPNVNLYVCDIDKGRLDKARNELPIKGYFTELEECLNDPEIDAVDLALPHYLHHEAVIEAAEKGKHIILEKPIARNLEEADDMIRVTKDNNVIFMIAENYHYMPSVRKMKKLIEDKIIGKVYLIRAYELFRGYLTSWRLSLEKSGGGNLIDSGIHVVHTVRYLAGSDAESVYARLIRETIREMEGEDTAVVTVNFKNGIVGSQITSWAVSVPGNTSRFIVHGDKGTLWLDNNGVIWLYSENFPDYLDQPVKVRYQDEYSVFEEVKHFVECIIEGKQPETTGIEGRKDLEIVMAAYLSARENKVINLPL